MKKVKIVLWVVVAAFAALVFFQNQPLFLEKKGFTLNLSYIAGNYNLELPLVVWFLITLMIGLLVSYLYGLAGRFKLKKIIKELNAKIDTQIEMISQIRSELEARSTFPAGEAAPASADIDTSVPVPSDVEPPSAD